VFMGCATKNAKVVVISLGSLQRLISLRAVPQSAVPHIVSIMSDAMSQGVDIQLRILQTLVSLIPNFPHIHGELLADVCHIFRAWIWRAVSHVSNRRYYFASSSKSLVLLLFHRLLQLLYVS